ncbi:MAG: glycosyltransferase family 1 protein [Anaerolineae bacterium]|nr:glycosyltransferase family 1 protein [Anaerolineae bacterium]
MKITILTAGTRGDVQPYLALALKLQSAGYEVQLGAPTNFASFVSDHGIEFAPLRADYYQLMDSPEGQALKSGNPIRVMQHMKTTVFPLMRRLMDDTWQAAQDTDAIIYHPKLFHVPHIAEKLNIPVMLAATVPILTATGQFPAPGVFNRNLGAAFNRLTYKALDLATSSFNGMVKEWRRDVLGLSEQSSVVKGNKINGRPIPVLYCYSQYVVPVPADWDGSAHVTGYWWLDEQRDWQPPEDLRVFLNAGDAPVYVGFGSMIAESPEQTTRTVIEALQGSGQRGIIASGWGGLCPADLPSTIYLLKEAPHEWLFPRMSAVIHHGGAGTTAAGLLAGKPTVICPFIADQPFWGNQVAKLGVGPKPIHQKHLSVEGLASAIRVAATDLTMRQKAADLGARLQEEDGTANALDVIEQILQPMRELV